jgi:Fe-S cluster assembly protein SufD
VAVDAQKVDAQQSNRNLLLSRDASVNAKPELEVYADDVKCAHGTTIGELDPHQVFYLRTRGLPEAEAKDLLTFAFASDLVQRVELKPVAERLTALMSSRFSRVQDVEGLL